MGLDKNNTNEFYLLGRFWAVVEMCNEARFSPTQVDQLFLDPTSVWRFDLNKQRNTDLRQNPRVGTCRRVATAPAYAQ